MSAAAAVSGSERVTLKLYGERNTGTTYLARLIEQNLDATLLPGTVPMAWFDGAQPAAAVLAHYGIEVQEFDELWRDLFFELNFETTLGWKHTLVVPEKLDPVPLAKEVVYVTLTKNPYSWLLSLYRRPYHRRSTPSDDLAGFVTTPWPTVRRENHPEPFETPVHLWNQKNSSYLALANERTCMNLTYETLLAQPREVIESIAAIARAERLGPFRNVDSSTKEDPSRSFAYYRRYYLDEAWKRELSDDVVALITQRLEPALLAHFGYAQL